MSSRDRAEYLGVRFFVHPIPFFAVVILAVNDHYLKYHFNSWWTGKLSDFAGLFFFPLFLCAIFVLIESQITGRAGGLRRPMLLVTMAFTDIVFALVKLLPSAAAFYERALGQLGFPSRVTLDPTDLIALSMNALTYWYARPYWRSQRGSI